jgi:hypothetical protein
VEQQQLRTGNVDHQIVGDGCSALGIIEHCKATEINRNTRMRAQTKLTFGLERGVLGENVERKWMVTWTKACQHIFGVLWGIRPTWH